jgi:hypothetical protein
MKALVPAMIGRLGNQLFSYAYTRALAAKEGREFRCNPWPGELIFDLPIPARPQIGDEIVGGYHQDQASLIYTRKQVKEWFKWRPEVEKAMKAFPAIERYQSVAHRRVGDYPDLGFVVVSQESYEDLADKLNIDNLEFFTEEKPHATLTPSLPPWVVDIYLITKASIILRGNSSFSWWAATLSDANIFSPNIEGLPGGRKEQYCQFEAGNHCKLSDHDFCSTLYLPEV